MTQNRGATFQRAICALPLPDYVDRNNQKIPRRLRLDFVQRQLTVPTGPACNEASRIPGLYDEE
jgi:hypothetical protein